MSKAAFKSEPAAYARYLRLHKDAGVPKYEQLREALATAIEKGVWKPGGRLPTEDDLTRTTRLSLGTVQRALRALENDGTLMRRQGHGTFVAEDHKRMSEPFYHCRFLNDDGSALLPIYSTVIGRTRAQGKGPWSAHIAGANIVCIERTFNVNDEFVIYTRLYLDADRFPAFGTWPFGRLHGMNFKNLLAAEFNLSLTKYTQTLVMRRFPPHICRVTGLRNGAMGNVIEIVARAKDGRPVYFQELHIPPTTRRMLIG